MRQLTFSLILLVAIAWLVSTDKVPDCSTCVMPCRGSNLNRQSLTKLYSSYVDSFTVTTILDGYEGNFKITISQNTTDYLVYSAKISVVHWYFSAFCRILCEIPVITTVVNDSTQLKVQFSLFRFFFVHLQSPEDTFVTLFYEKVGILQNMFSMTNEVLTNTLSKLSTATSEISETRNEVQILKENINLISERVQSISRPIKVCEARDLSNVIANARISGLNWRCIPSGTNTMLEPRDLNYCQLAAGNYVYFDLRDVFIINVIRFRLWDGDSRTYTYSLDILNENNMWVSLAPRVTGQSTEEYQLEEPTGVRTIRMEGYNSGSAEFHLLSIAINCI